MEKKNSSPIKKLSSLFSKTGISSFLDDSAEKQALEKAQADIIKQLQIAAAQKGIVVLKLQEDEHTQNYETVSGWIATKTVGNENVMLKITGDDRSQRGN